MSIQPLSNSGTPAPSAPVARPPRIEPPSSRETASAHAPRTEDAPSSVPSPLPVSSEQQKDAVRHATKKVNDLITGLSSDLKFTVDEDTGIDIVKVIDVKTKEVIRQVPAQEMLEIAKRLDELQGLLIREKA